ncbi:hypothetical protein BGZ72_003838 [Mortierella alpina]|nr:hypothetical protein BGZ72_003838 [Mortierella alpina]
MAPNCNTSLTLRNFQMAALDESVLDAMTGRPAKVLVCKEHVPMPKTSFGADTLAFKHMTSAPKPSMPGLHRSLMGERGNGTTTSTTTTMMMENQPHVSSPRSLAQGSHAVFLKNLNDTSKADADEGEGGEQKSSRKKNDGRKEDEGGEEEVEKVEEEDKKKKKESGSSTTTTTTLPKYQRGRFTISDSDSLTVAHAAAEDAQDPNKDDDSFRNLPVRHQDYGHKEGHTTEDNDGAKTAKDDAEDWDQAAAEEEEEEDHKQERVFTMKGSGMASANKSNGGSSFMKKLEQSLDKQPPSTATPRGRGGEIEVALESPVDISDRVQRDHLKVDLENDREIEAAEIKAPPGEAEEKKLVDMAFSSKLMQQQQRNKKKNKKKNSLTVDKAVEDDEWGAEATSTTDNLSRRESVAGM